MKLLSAIKIDGRIERIEKRLSKLSREKRKASTKDTEIYELTQDLKAYQIAIYEDYWDYKARGLTLQKLP